MGTSALFDVIDGLVTAFTAVAPTGCRVFDGPSVEASNALEAVVVGFDDVMPGDYRSGREDQTWASIGAQSKDCRGSVLCTLAVHSGGGDVKTVRDRAQVILAALETALRSDIDLDGGTLISAELSSVELRQQRPTTGVGIRVSFTVAYRARI